MQQTNFDAQLFTPFSSHTNNGTISQGSLTEIIIDESSSLQAFHLISLLMQCKIEERWLMWLSPNKSVNKQWLKSLNLSSAPIVSIETTLNNQKELAKRILTAQTGHIILEWSAELDLETRAELSKLAKATNTQVMLIRKRF